MKARLGPEAKGRPRPEAQVLGVLMRRVLWGLAGFFGTGLLVGAVGFALPSLVTIPQNSGGYAMGVAFFWVPLGAVLGAVVAVISSRR